MSVLASGANTMIGVGNLTRRELTTWTGGRGLRLTLVWALTMGGLLSAMLWLVPLVVAETGAGGTSAGDAQGAAVQFPDLAAVVVAVGVVLLTQGILLDERRNGVLEWLLSKPLARPAVIVAKFVGQGLGLLVTVVLVPWLMVHALLSVAAGELWAPTRSLAAVALLGLVVLFHLALVLALSTLTSSRVVILAVPIAAIVSADGITGLVPDAFHVLPWSLGPLASVALADGMLVTGWPVVATVVWTGLLLAVAAVVLGREEL